MQPLLEVKDLRVHFPVRAGLFSRVVAKVHAVDGVSLDVRPGETLGLVGESGCGKTTLGRSMLGLYHDVRGEVLFEGQNLLKSTSAQTKMLRRNIQMVFQDPMESLNSKLTVGTILREPFDIHGTLPKVDRRAAVHTLLERVGLGASAADKFPHEFSGGQRQRIGIARAIALNPKLVVCDEPVSALDVSIQAQILNLLMELQREMGLTYVFIAHGLPVVRHVADRIAVMYLGKVVELGAGLSVYQDPAHPYSKALLKSVPTLGNKAKISAALVGEVPSPMHPPAGCRFHTRCPYATETCKTTEPKLGPLLRDSSRQVACHYADTI